MDFFLQLHGLPYFAGMGGHLSKPQKTLPFRGDQSIECNSEAIATAPGVVMPPACELLQLSSTRAHNLRRIRRLQYSLSRSRPYSKSYIAFPTWRLTMRDFAGIGSKRYDHWHRGILQMLRSIWHGRLRDSQLRRSLGSFSQCLINEDVGTSYRCHREAVSPRTLTATMIGLGSQEPRAAILG